MKTIVYRINDDDEVFHVSANWDTFAMANKGEAIVSQSVLNRPLWDFIADPGTQHVYEEVLQRIRSGGIGEGESMRFEFRCDSPACRRPMAMEVAPADEGLIEFRIHFLAQEPRPFQPLLDPDTSRSDEWLRICGWCKKVDVGNDEWLEIEDAVARLGLFDRTTLPQLTHGMCDACYARVIGELEAA